MESNWKKKARSPCWWLACFLPGCIAAGARRRAAPGSISPRVARIHRDGSIDDVEAARAVFGRRACPSPDPDGEQRDKRELKGKKDDLDITVSMERPEPADHQVEVSARRPRHLDKLRQQLLSKIVSRVPSRQASTRRAAHRRVQPRGPPGG